MTQIALKTNVSVRAPSESNKPSFFVVQAGTFVNYFSKDRDGKTVHSFHAGTPNGVLTHIEVTEIKDRPKWL